MVKIDTKGALLRFISLLLLVLGLGGCGDVNWFPAYKRQPTTPDQFTFTTKKGVAVNTAVTSDPITVAGLTAASSPISVTGPVSSNSQYSINGGTATTTAGTVKNGDKVTVTHTSAAGPGQVMTSTLTIGDVSATFTSTTQLVANPVWSAPVTVAGGFLQVFATITAIDTTPHTISIKDSNSSGSATYSIADINGNPTVFLSTPEVVAVLNGLRIYVRNSVTNVNADVTTTLTIDGVEYTVPLK